MNLGEIKAVVERYGFDADDPLNAWINEAQDRIEDYHDWPFLEKEYSTTLSATQSTLALPSDYIALKSLRVASYNGGKPYNPEYLDIDRWEREINDTTDGGRPEFFTILSTTDLRFWRVPEFDTPVVIRYKKTTTDLAQDTDIPSLPTRLHYAIGLGAAAIALQAENEEDRAQTALSQRDDILNLAISAMGGKVIGNFPTVRDAQGYLYGN